MSVASYFPRLSVTSVLFGISQDATSVHELLVQVRVGISMAAKKIINGHATGTDLLEVPTIRI